MKLLYSIKDNQITILHRGKPNVITRDRWNYQTILDAIKADDAELTFDLLDEVKAIKTVSKGKITITDGKVFYKKKEIHGALVKKLNHLLESGFTNLDRWMLFTEKLMKNPSMRSREQSYPFIARTDILITPDGNCLGYKGVNHNYFDRHSGTFDNSVGKEYKVDRSEVDDDPNNGCSYGFHIGSHKYADNWGGSDGKLMIAEFNPKHIVSVPHDCNHEKLRVCKYKIVDECTDRALRTYTNIDASDDDLFEFIYHQCMQTETVTLGCVQEQFPNTTMSDIISLGESRPEYRISTQFNDDFMDYNISLEYTD